MKDARVGQVWIEGEPKALPRMIDAPTYRAGTRALVEVTKGHWTTCEVVAHPDGILTSATVHVRILTNDPR